MTPACASCEQQGPVASSFSCPCETSFAGLHGGPLVMWCTYDTHECRCLLALHLSMSKALTCGYREILFCWLVTVHKAACRKSWCAALCCAFYHACSFCVEVQRVTDSMFMLILCDLILPQMRHNKMVYLVVSSAGAIYDQSWINVECRQS